MAGADRHAKLAEQILDAVLGMGLRRGDRLVEKQLAETCNVSRTPIRSALKFLEGQGVAEKPEDGGFVLACDADDAVARLRTGSGGRDGELAERIGIEVDKPNGQANGHDTIRTSLVATYPYVDEHGEVTYEVCRYEPKTFRDPADFREIDLAFHRLIARSSGNAFVTEALMAHHGLRAMAGDSGDLNDFRIRQALDEHVRILDYLSQDQYELAADLMRVHLRISRNRRPSVANRGAPALAFALRAAR